VREPKHYIAKKEQYDVGITLHDALAEIAILLNSGIDFEFKNILLKHLEKRNIAHLLIFYEDIIKKIVWSIRQNSQNYEIKPEHEILFEIDGVTIAMRADRVDIGQSDVRICDYKTTYTNKMTPLSSYRGLALQLPTAGYFYEILQGYKVKMSYLILKTGSEVELLIEVKKNSDGFVKSMKNVIFKIYGGKDAVFSSTYKYKSPFYKYFSRI
jgi:hypothetical protein